MANIINVTQPVTGQESTNRINSRPSQQDVGIYQTPDPTKVQPAKDRNVNADRQNESGGPNLESNFEQFLQMVRNSRGVTQQYGEFFFSKMGNLASSGMEGGLAAELMKYMSMLKMSKEELLAMIKGNQGDANKFSGPFFDAMRRIMLGSGSSDLKFAVLDLLRKYDNMTSSGHILKNLMSNLENIAQRMPSSVAQQLRELMIGLDSQVTQGEHEANLNLLKKEIMPFLGGYISGTRDFGAVRDLIAMFTLNLARYDAGTKSVFLNALQELLGFSEAGNQLAGMSLDELVAQLCSQSASTGLTDSLADIISAGMKGEAGYQSKALFQNIASSVLLNESVYMPLLHVMVPAELDGKHFFSEMWVDPDSQDGSETSGGGQAVKILIKFDIKELGYFELVMLVQDGKADMELSYPPALVHSEKQIREGLSGIMAANNLSFRSFVLSQGARKKTISEVFPKIYEGRNTINVTI